MYWKALCSSIVPNWGSTRYQFCSTLWSQTAIMNACTYFVRLNKRRNKITKHKRRRLLTNYCWMLFKCKFAKIKERDVVASSSKTFHPKTFYRPSRGDKKFWSLKVEARQNKKKVGYRWWSHRWLWSRKSKSFHLKFSIISAETFFWKMALSRSLIFSIYNVSMQWTNINVFL